LGTVRVAQIRLAGSSLFLAVSAYLGYGTNLADWRAYVGLLLAYVGIAVALLLALRVRSLLTLQAYLGPLTDCAVVCLLQLRSLPLSPYPAGVAGWSLGLFVFLVLLSSLTLRRSVIALTTVAACLGEGVLQRAAEVGWGAVFSSVLILGLTASAMAWVMRRLDKLIDDWVAAEVRKRVAVEHGEELDRANLQILDANAKLVEAQRQSELLARLLVHDMKGPLTAVLGMLELLQMHADPKGDANQIEADLNIARQAALRLQGMVGDVLRVARLEAGTVKPNLQDTDIAAFLTQVARTYGGAAKMRGVDVTVQADSLMTAALDRELFQRLLDNLMSNALRFVGKGNRIALCAALAGGELSVAVRNDGAPIEPAARAELFGKFAPVASESADHAGLGLYLCRLVAEAHGGSIRIEEAPGWAVSFVVRIPRSPSQASA
jgi:two-component system, OmpR family, heavy metal sensor histidine kinase CusS